MSTAEQVAGTVLIALGVFTPTIGASGLLVDTVGLDSQGASSRAGPDSVPPCGSGLAAVDRCTRWIETFDRGTLDPSLGVWNTGSRDVALAVATASSEGLTVAVGRSEDPDGGTDPLAIALETAHGEARWSWLGDLAGEGRDEVTHVEVDAARRQVLLVLEDDQPRAFQDTLVVALDLDDGKRRWVTQIPEEQGPRVAVKAIEQGQGVFYLVGEAEVMDGYTSHDDVFLAKLDPADGSIDWTTHWDGRDDDDVVLDVALDAAGDRLYAVGSTSGFGTGPDVLALAADAKSGAVVWAQRMTGTGSPPWDWAYRLALDPDSDRLVLTGLETLSGRPQRLTAALDAASGTVDWRRQDSAPGLGGGVRVGTLGDRVLVTGSVGTTGLALDDGSLLWSSSFQGSRLVVGEQQAEVYVTQTVQRKGTTFDCVTRAFSTVDGEVRWEADYRGPNVGLDNQPGGSRVADRCWDVALDPSREALLVAGDTWQPGRDADLLVLSYRQTPTEPHPDSPDSTAPTPPNEEVIEPASSQAPTDSHPLRRADPSQPELGAAAS